MKKNAVGLRGQGKHFRNARHFEHNTLHQRTSLTAARYLSNISLISIYPYSGF